MIKNAHKSDPTVIRLTLVTVVAFLLTGVALLVSANTQLPVVSGPERLLQHSLNASNKFATGTKTGSMHMDGLLRSDIASFEQIDIVGATSANSDMPFKPVSVNVNTFLQSQRISDQSQLAELQMQPYFAEFDSTLFVIQADVDNNADESAIYVIEAELTTEQLSTFAGIGFPHIETNARSDANRYKPYKQLLSFSSDESGAIVPHVKCMGLSPQRVANRAKKYDAKILELAAKYNVSASLVKAVVAKESCYDPEAKSYVGAIGLMQLMPETANWLKVAQPENPHQNLAGGIRYLAQLRKRFGSDELALAAYNAGPGNVERYNGIPPFAETQNYVQDVMYFYRGYLATTRFLNAQNSY